jgi:drug/metabolite transporter (DMT)-like permease
MAKEIPLLRIRFLLITCVVIWGWTFVATKICLSYLTAVELVGLRLLIGLPMLGAVLVFQNIRLDFTTADLRQLIPGSIVIAVHFLIQAYALGTTSATNTGWIIAVTPLALAFLSFLILKERLGGAESTGIAIATAGILLLVSRGSITELGWLESPGDWLILLSAHTWALYTILTRDLSRSRNPLAVTFVIFLPLATGCLTFMVATSGLGKVFSLPVDGVVALLFLGSLGILAQWFWQMGVARLGAGKAGIYLYLEPVATTVLAVPLLGESFSFTTAIGGSLVLAGVWWSERRRRAPAGGA